MPSRLSQALCLSALLPLSACGFFGESEEEFVARQMSYMVFVEGGEFMMGNPGGWDMDRDAWPPVKVHLSDFRIQKFEITQGDFEYFLEKTDWELPDQNPYSWIREDNPERFDEALPAIASWDSANAFCNWLGKMSGKAIALPSEAQWEYAARSGGQLIRFATDDGTLRPGENIIYGDDWRNGAPQASSPLPPGSFPPNEIGLFDMAGNVYEWVSDLYAADAYRNYSVEKDPVGQTPNESPLGGIKRLVRGGYYGDLMGSNTVARVPMRQIIVAETIGFRCAMISGN